MSALSVVTPKGVVLERPVDEVTAPGVDGEFGVLDGHIPFISATKAGVLLWRKGSERGKLALGPGYVQVDGKGGVVALVQQALLGEDVDREAAEKQLKEADAQGRKAETRPDQDAAQAAAAWAQAQLDARQ